MEGGPLGMMIGTNAQKNGFNERLVRIAKGGENTTRHLYVGPVEEAVTGRKRRVKKVKAPRIAGSRTFFSELFMLPFAFLAGAAAVLGGRVAAFHLVPTDEAAAALGVPAWTVTYGWLASAAVLAILAMLFFRLRGGGRFKLLFVGFASMVLFERLAIARAPEFFTPLYSEEHVVNVIAKVAEPLSEASNV